MRFAALIAIAALAGCTFVAPTATTPPAPGQMTEALAAAAAAYEEAQITGDAATLERLIADDYQLVGSDGSRDDKAGLIAFWTADGFDPSPVTVVEPVEHVWTDGAALGGTVTLSGVMGGESFSTTIRYIDIWALRDGEWRVVYGQTTRVPDPA
jgi:hypothetical protein